MVTQNDNSASNEEYPEFTLQKLHEACALIQTPGYKDIFIRFEVSPALERELRTRLSTVLYNPPSPNSILARYMGMPIWVDTELPDGAIVFVYKTSKGERRVLKVFNLEGAPALPLDK